MTPDEPKRTTGEATTFLDQHHRHDAVDARIDDINDRFGTEDWIRTFFAPLGGGSHPSVDEVYTIGG